MEFKFYCPHCGQHISATTNQVGKRGACPTCSRAFDVPAPAGYQSEQKSPPPPPPSQHAAAEAQNPPTTNIPPPPPQEKKPKSPFSFVGIALVVLVIVGIRSCFSGGSDASKITNVLDRCAEIGQRAAQYNANPGAQANFIAREFQKIDVANCPQDFRAAFQAHIFAWQQAGPYLGNDTLSTSFLEGVLAGATKDSRFIGAAGDQAALARQQINSTYFSLTQIAARYGARVPNSVAGD